MHDPANVSIFAPLIALLPIFWLLLSLGMIKMPAHKACLIGLLASAVLAHLVWAMPLPFLASAALEGFVFALLPILWIILAAFLTYNISLRTGAIDTIKALLSSISQDRRIQALLIAWGFGSFLEAVAGFGTAVAVPAALLISLGFKPFLAALICLLANTVAVAFGVVGIPVTTLAQVTSLPVTVLSEAIIVQLTPFVFCVPAFIILTLTRSLAGLAGVWLPTLVSGASFGLAQFLTVRYIGPELPAILGSIAAFTSTVLVTRLFPPKSVWRFAGEGPPEPDNTASTLAIRAQLRAWSPYLFLLLLVLLTSRLFPPVHTLLARASSSLLVYSGSGGKPLVMAWLLTPGTLVMTSAIIGGLLQGASPAILGRVLLATLNQLRKTAVTILCIVAMAKVLSYSGMIMSISTAMAALTGVYYALVSPVLGMLGTFITGSDTSANILFGQLQKEVALSIGIDPIWLAAANTSGACIGKLISPQSIAIASIAANLTGQEGALLLAAMRYAIAFVAVLSVLVFVFA